MNDLAVIVRDPLDGKRTTVFGGQAGDVARRAALIFGDNLDLAHYSLNAGLEMLPDDELVGRVAPEYELSRVRSPL